MTINNIANVEQLVDPSIAAPRQAETAKPEPTPATILQTAFSFWSSKVLLTAVELGVFTQLADRHLTGIKLGEELGLHPRAIADFFDTLVAMRFLDRDGNGSTARYFNTPDGALFLDQASPRYVGGILVMLNARLFKYWNDLPEALRTGKPQNEVKHNQTNIFLELYADATRLEQFMGAMTGISRVNFEAFAAKFDFSKYNTSATLAARPACSPLKPPRSIRISTQFPSICRRSNPSPRSTLPPSN